MKTLFLWMCVGALVLAACGGGEPASSSVEDGTLATVPAEYAGLTNPLGADAAEEGAQVFESNCAMCHGSQGHGDGPAGQSLEPRPKNLADVQAQAGDDYLFWRIHDGKPGTSMVAWKGILSDEQIWQTVAFLRTLR
jgi:mono/diheme cytochrome c family protein